MNAKGHVGVLVAMAITVGACRSSSGGSTAATVPTTREASTAAGSVPTPLGSSSVVTTGTAAVVSSTTSGALDGVWGALRDGDVTAFATALRAANVLDGVGVGEVTIFAPNDAAFAAVPADTMRGLLGDPARLKLVLQNHVVEGVWTTSKLASAGSVTAKSGRVLPITGSDGRLVVDGAHVVRTASTKDKVVVYVIDKVLTGGLK